MLMVADAEYERELTAFNGVYDQPWTRISPYLLGLCLGYILHRTKRALRMNIVIVVLGEHRKPDVEHSLDKRPYVVFFKSRLARLRLSARRICAQTTIRRQTEPLGASRRCVHHAHRLVDDPVLDGAGICVATWRTARTCVAVASLATVRQADQLCAARSSGGDALAAAQHGAQPACVGQFVGEQPGSIASRWN